MTVPRKATANLVLATFLAGIGVPVQVVHADGFTPRVIVSHQTTQNGSLTSSGLRQTYDLRLEKTLSEPAEFRLFLRGEDFTGTNDVEGVQSDSGFRQLQPGAEFNYRLPKLQWGVRYDSTKTDSRSSSFDDTRRLERINGNFLWSPDRVPSLALNVQRNTATDDASSLNRVDDLASASLGYHLRNLEVLVTSRYSQLSDGREGFARRSVDQQGMVTYQDNFAGGKVMALANATAIVSAIDERARAGGPVRVPNPVPVPRVLYAIDDTPLDSRDRPLEPISGLNDGNTHVPTAVSFGPGAPTYQNIAFDFGRFADVDEIRVLARDAEGSPLRGGGAIRFDVFSSDDAITWRPLPAGARTTFDASLSSYNVEFQLLTARYLKIVSFGVNVDPTFVTETEAYFHRTIPGKGTLRTNSTLYNGFTSLTAKPLHWLETSYTGLFNASSQKSENRADVSTTDADHIGSVNISPLRWLSFGGRYESRILDQAGGFTQTYQGWTGLVRLIPTSALNVTLESQKLSETLQTGPADTSALILHTFARILPSLDVTFDVGERDQSFPLQDQKASSRFLNATTNAQLTRGLRLLLTGSLQRAEYSGSDIVQVGLPPAQDDRWTAEIYWRPGRPFALSARTGMVKFDNKSTPIQQYRVEWYPFADGTVSIGGTFDEDVDPYSNRTSQRIIVTPRWAINKFASFDVNYMALKTTGDMASDMRSLYATITLTK